MGYQIIEPYSNVTIPNGLGVGFNSNRPIYLTVDQAFQNLRKILRKMLRPMLYIQKKLELLRN